MALISDISQLDLGQPNTCADYLGWRSTEYMKRSEGKPRRKMSALTWKHRPIASKLHRVSRGYLRRPPCQVYPSSFHVCLLRRPGGGVQLRTAVQPIGSVTGDLGKTDGLGTPDWIIEVVSPSFIVPDTRTKFDLHAENDGRE